MKSNPLRYVLLILIAVSLIGTLSTRFLSGLSWSSSDPGETLQVLVASRYIPPFSVIKPELVQARDFPKAYVPPGALLRSSELHNSNEQFVFTSAVAIPEGQPLTRTLLVDRSQNDSLATLLRPGKVAVSFEVDRSRSVGGWIKPGDTVAIFRLVPPDGSGHRNENRYTRLLLPAVAIAAVDKARLGLSKDKSEESSGDPMRNLDAPSGDSRIVTVLLNQAEACALIEAREQGPLSVVLRSPGDDLPWATGN
jgi:Flp pilus assembly protein CpaB